MLEDVVIVCISGRGGVSSPSGITTLRDTLRDKLASLGVKTDNIFRISWNHRHDDDGTKEPNISYINDEIKLRSKSPSYLALIGHSYGGWAAWRLSHITTRKPDFIGLLDPVFGIRNSMRKEQGANAVKIKNWYQNHAIDFVSYCEPWNALPCYVRTAGLGCGYRDVPEADIERVDRLKNWDGDIEKDSCLGGTYEVEKLSKHTNMDDNEHLHRKIYEQIYDDLYKMILAEEEMKIIISLCAK